MFYLTKTRRYVSSEMNIDYKYLKIGHVFINSCEQGLITKERIVTHTHLNCLHFSKLLISFLETTQNLI